MSRLARPLLGVLVAATLVIFAATPALAYGKDNWQLGISATGVDPSTGQGLGAWGWCAFGGGVTSGNDGDCEFSLYIHAPSGSGFTCEESLDITSWDVNGPGGTFEMTGTAAVNPTSATAPCLAFFPGTGSASFTQEDCFGAPAAPGHYTLVDVFEPGFRGTAQVQVTQIS